jgi:hypothetical protein
MCFLETEGYTMSAKRVKKRRAGSSTKAQPQSVIQSFIDLEPPPEKMHEFPSGAKRAELKPRFDLIPSAPLRRLAARYEMGLKYGEDNWKKGLPLSDTLNHIIDHLLIYRDKQKTSASIVDDYDDDLAAAAWGCFALMWLEENDKLF